MEQQEAFADGPDSQLTWRPSGPGVVRCESRCKGRAAAGGRAPYRLIHSNGSSAKSSRKGQGRNKCFRFFSHLNLWAMKFGLIYSHSDTPSSTARIRSEKRFIRWPHYCTDIRVPLHSPGGVACCACYILLCAWQRSRLAATTSPQTHVSNVLR